MNESNEQSVTTNSELTLQTPLQPAKKAWSQPIMTLLEISATANAVGPVSDGVETQAASS